MHTALHDFRVGLVVANRGCETLGQARLAELRVDGKTQRAVAIGHGGHEKDCVLAEDDLLMEY